MLAQHLQAINVLSEAQRKLAALHTSESISISILIGKTIAPLRMAKPIPSDVVRQTIQRIRRSAISDDLLKRAVVNNLSVLLTMQDV